MDRIKQYIYLTAMTKYSELYSYKPWDQQGCGGKLFNASKKIIDELSTLFKVEYK